MNKDSLDIKESERSLELLNKFVHENGLKVIADEESDGCVSVSLFNEYGNHLGTISFQSVDLK